MNVHIVDLVLVVYVIRLGYRDGAQDEGSRKHSTLMEDI